MSEEELLYAALKSPLGLVVRADKARLLKAKAKIAKTDAALLDLSILGPDRSGQLFIIRNAPARKVLNEH